MVEDRILEFRTPAAEHNCFKNKNTMARINTTEGIDDFVVLTSIDKDILIDLKYATEDNFTRKVVYPRSICVLRKNTAEKLVRANARLKGLGYRIKVWDAYRPVYVQKIFWDMVRNNDFIANPYTGGSIHNKGCAVDVTLVDEYGNDVEMPSEFDDFSYKASRNNLKMSQESKRNLDILTRCMTDNGFSTIDSEWWHFVDVEYKKYEVVDIDLDLFK